jgi:phosphoribosyl 1,2-cyclic phosphate phosphodiesterase
MMQVTLLGTGTSTGVPMIGCDCRVCRSTDTRDKRLRVSALLNYDGTNVLIDTSADFRQQMLTANVKKLDAIFYTHHHYDHIAGFDDLRAFQFLLRSTPQCYALPETFEQIKQTFNYAFGAKVQSGGGLPKADFTMIGTEPIQIKARKIQPIPLKHGSLDILGFRVGGFAYLTDCNAIPESSMELLKGLDTLVLDGLRGKPHPTHFSLGEAVQHAEKIGARITYLTHMNHDVMHAEIEKTLPDSVRLGYDGLTFTID